MPELKEILANTYCNAVAEYFSRNKLSIDEDLTNLSPQEQEAALYQIITNYSAEKSKVIEKWANTPLEELQGSTPDQAISDLSSLEQVFEIFTHIARAADEHPPALLIKKLQQYGNDAVSQLYQLAVDNRDGEPPADYLFAASVITLGTMVMDECIEALITLAYQVEKEPQLEQIEAALKLHKDRTIEPILERMGDTGFGNVETMLLYVLACSGANDDRIYRLIRSAFRTMDNKMHAILCFEVYGDGRAVPMLRSFLEKNAHGLPDRVFHQIVGTIRRLGGNTEDFMNAHHHAH
ncbi:MAG: hypothetical protein GX144_03680 [Clostridiaceae bacterium]|nr:hypothetical protein [Clostridiaceae bacterium]